MERVTLFFAVFAVKPEWGVAGRSPAQGVGAYLRAAMPSFKAGIRLALRGYFA
jgi:hypothetical protein